MGASSDPRFPANDLPSDIQRSANGAAEKPTASKKAKPASDAAPKVSKGKASGKATSKAGAEAGKSKEAIAEQEGGEGGEETKEEEEKKAQEEKEEEAPASAKSTGKQLKVGDKLPKLVLKDEEGKEVDVSGLAGEKGVVVFLYPKVGGLVCWYLVRLQIRKCIRLGRIKA